MDRKNSINLRKVIRDASLGIFLGLVIACVGSILIWLNSTLHIVDKRLAPLIVTIIIAIPIYIIKGWYDLRLAKKIHEKKEEIPFEELNRKINDEISKGWELIVYAIIGIGVGIFFYFSFYPLIEKILQEDIRFIRLFSLIIFLIIIILFGFRGIFHLIIYHRLKKKMMF